MKNIRAFLTEMGAAFTFAGVPAIESKPTLDLEINLPIVHRIPRDLLA